MTKRVFLSKLEEILELTPGTLVGHEQLSELEGWDSVTVVEFLAFVDEEFALAISPKVVAACRSVQDLAGLLAPNVDPW
jgi:acyl carrier protein